MSMPDFIAFMKSFAQRKGLSKKVTLEFRSDKGRPRVYCDEPVIVARLWSQLRQETGPTKRLLIRGQTHDHPGMTPGLFRLPNNKLPVAKLLKAETAFEAAVAKALSGHKRFKRPDLSALTQHYGFHTSWLDVVDNLWTAVWFATHSVSQGKGRVVTTSQNKSGWIYFLAIPHGCSAVDLRVAHHGLSLRAHAQAGWSIRGDGPSIADLNKFVIAVVEFPVTKQWRLAGHLASEGFFFPASRLDDTLRRLYERDVDQVAGLIERQQALPDGTLGRVFPRSGRR